MRGARALRGTIFTGKLPGSYREITGKLPGSYREIMVGNFPVTSQKFPGRKGSPKGNPSYAYLIYREVTGKWGNHFYREVTGKLPGSYREITGKLPGNNGSPKARIL